MQTPVLVEISLLILLNTFAGVEPKYMGIAPIVAIPKVLAMTGLRKEDIDIYEVSNHLWGFRVW